MSIEGLTAFFARLQEDTDLQEKARAADGTDEEKLAALCALAADAGFAVSPEDLRAARADPARAALEDETLEDVSGGGCSVTGAVAFGSGGSITPMG